MNGRRTLVAEERGEVVGFAELEGDGHPDMFYVRGDAWAVASVSSFTGRSSERL